MKLLHITAETCSVCGAVTQTETIKERHCSGEWNEYRIFSCGAELRYSPSYKKVLEARPCPNSPDQVARKAEYEALQKELLYLINTSDARIEVKDALANRVRQSYFYM